MHLEVSRGNCTCLVIVDVSRVPILGLVDSISNQADPVADMPIGSDQAQQQDATPDLMRKDDSPSTLTDFAPVSSQNASLDPARSSIDEELASPSDVLERSPLSSRPGTSELMRAAQRSPSNTLQVPRKSSRPQLQSTATTALSLTDIHTHAYADGTRETYAQSAKSTPSRKSFVDRSYEGTEVDDSASVRSFVPGSGTTALDAESILGDVLIADQQSPSWKLLSEQVEARDHLDELPFDDSEPRAGFNREFDELAEIDAEGTNEGKLASKTGANTCLKLIRGTLESMAIKEEALSHPICSWKTDL